MLNVEGIIHDMPNKCNRREKFMKINPTKQKVVDVATWLFYQKGFHGTSVRDISDSANVNVSLISYYFNSKQGLLEHAVINYYELYFEVLEETLQNYKDLTSIDKLKKVVHSMLEYKMEHFHLTYFIQRELSLDTTFVREMTVTYLAKENNLLHQLFLAIFRKKKTIKQEHLFMQLKGMLLTPFILKNESHHQFIDQVSRENFIDTYIEVIFQWIEFLQNIK